MRLALTYAQPDGWYYEWCSLDEAQKDSCAYPDVGCLHQGYNIPKKREKGADRTEAEARAESLALATPFLAAEAGRAEPLWQAHRLQKERKARAEAKEWAAVEKVRQEELARLKGPP